MQRNRHLAHLRAEPLERGGALAHQRMHVRFRVRVAEAFLHDGDPDTARVAREHVRVAGGLDVHLAQVKASTSSSSALSATVAVIGPMWSSISPIGKMPVQAD